MLQHPRAYARPLSSLSSPRVGRATLFYLYGFGPSWWDVSFFQKHRYNRHYITKGVHTLKPPKASRLFSLVLFLSFFLRVFRVRFVSTRVKLAETTTTTTTKLDKSKMLYRIDVLESDDATTKTASSFALHPNVPTILGRDATLAHIPIEHASVSRKHAIVTIVVAVSEANEKTGTSSSGGETYLEVTDCGSKLGTRVKGVIVEEGKVKDEDEDEDEEKEIKLDKFETKRVRLKTRGKVFVKFGKISASVRCVEEDGGGLDEDEANENVEEKGDATESEDEDEDEREEEEEEENDDDDDVGAGWKHVQTKMEKKKTGGNKGQANVDRDEVEVETVIDASLFREQMISSPRLVSAIEEGENDENRRQVDINADRDDNKNKKRFRKQPITINGKLTVDGVDNAGSFSPRKRLNKKKQKVPWLYETDGYETLAQFETALDREEKAAQRLKEKIAEDLFTDPSTNGASFKKRKGATASAKGGGRGIRKRS